jgi:hypothetical protein
MIFFIVDERLGIELPDRPDPAILAAMNPTKLVSVALVIACECLALSVPSAADDSAASIAAGGLVPRRETRIVMAKEVLRISPTKIVVDYEFRNDSDQDVTTEVAFPIPPYKNEFPEGDIQSQSFKTFHLWVEGKPVHYESEVKATLNGKDVTGLLKADHIDIPTFGHFDDTTEDAQGVGQVLVPDLTRLSKPVQSRLIEEGLFEDEGGVLFSLYTVHLQYHWTQTFPAHSTVRIHHEYTAVVGFEMMPVETFKNSSHHTEPGGNDESARGQRDDIKFLNSFCPDPPLLRSAIHSIENVPAESGPYAYPRWIDFILTSANTWKQPIEDFTLIVERGRSEVENAHTLVSFCTPQNAVVEKLDADHFQVHLTNFIPASELHIGFFDLPEARAAPKQK